MDYGIFNLHTDANACNCTWGCTDTVRESGLKVDCGRNSLAALGNWTCICDVPVQWSTDWAIALPAIHRASTTGQVPQGTYHRSHTTGHVPQGKYHRASTTGQVHWRQRYPSNCTWCCSYWAHRKQSSAVDAPLHSDLMSPLSSSSSKPVGRDHMHQT